jgi:hypothetical protein
MISLSSSPTLLYETLYTHFFFFFVITQKMLSFINTYFHSNLFLFFF